MSRLALTVICGGVSAEHEISIHSAKNIVVGLDPKKYDIQVLYIDKNGAWWLLRSTQPFADAPLGGVVTSEAISVGVRFDTPTTPLQSLEDLSHQFKVDCFFPILHGTDGEDGTFQGLLDLLQVPFVGPDVLSCAVSMNKAVAKELLLAKALPVVPWVEIKRREREQASYESCRTALGDTIFVKPVHLGSSVGISKVKNASQFKVALDEAFKYDDTVVVESAIHGREIECGVIGNRSPVASMPGEIISHHAFYDYNAKYVDPNGADTIVPADLDQRRIDEIRELAVAAYQTVRAEGLMRVDFFLTELGEVYINELNPLPGFTNISLFPKMWEATELSYSDLLDKLIQYALERQQEKKRVTTHFIDTSRSAS